MLISSLRRQGLLRYRREYPQLQARMRAHLKNIRMSVEKSSEIAINGDDVGLKVWLLPPWYAAALGPTLSAKRALADFSAATFGRPTVICAGELRATGVAGTGRSWAIGKGLIGMAMFDVAPEGFHCVVHGDELARFSDMTLREFRRQDEDLIHGRSRADVRALCSTYGAAVGVGLRDSPRSPAFGCITLDVPSGTEVDRPKIEACGDLLVNAMPNVVGEVADWGKYRLV